MFYSYLILSARVIVENFDSFSMYILILRGNISCMKNKKVAEATCNLQFDIVMVQNSFHPIYKLSFQVIELLLTLLQFSHTKQWNNNKKGQ